MTGKESIREKLLSLLAHQPCHIIDGMIKITKPARPLSIERSSNSSNPLGTLNVLPLELLHSILEMLDLQTLSSITRTCLRGTAIVKSLPAYRDLLRHAPRALAALGMTRLLRCHSANALYVTLLSAKCASCSEYGAFLFLPTCERCCYECLWRNQSLWVISMSEAQRCFDLSPASVRRLPTLHSVPGQYYVRYSISRKRQLRLVSVRAAKELATKENKSASYLAQDLENRRTAGLSLDEYYTQRWLQAAPLQSPETELTTRSTQANVPNDKFCGMASILFPSLSSGDRVESGLWCLGCEETYREWSPHRPNELVSQLVATGSDTEETLYALQHVARTETVFFEHILHCPGARILVPDLEEELRRMMHA